MVENESRIEPSVKDDPPGSRYQFERVGYFCSDVLDSTPSSLVFNRTVGLRDSWAKISAKVDQVGDSGAKSSAAIRKADRKEQKANTADAPASPKEYSEEVIKRAKDLGIAVGDADLLSKDSVLAELFEAALASYDNPKAVVSWIVNDLRRELKKAATEKLLFDGSDVGSLAKMVDSGSITRANGRDVLTHMIEKGGDPETIVKQKGLEQVADPDAIGSILRNVLSEYPDKVNEYRAGRVGLLGFFVGQVMRESAGKANPALVKELVEKELTRPQ